MNDFIYLFIGINLFNVAIQTVKSILTVKGNKWVASFISALTYFVYTYVIVFTTSDSLSTLEKAIIVGACNLIGVFVVKLIEEKMQKDKLWIYQATCKEDNETVAHIHKTLKELGIACVYNEIVKDSLYSMQVFSYTPKESTMIKSILDNYKVKYSAVETKLTSENKKEKNEDF